MAVESRSRGRVRFGAFELDCSNGDLRRDGTSLKLQPQPAKVLAVLVSRAGQTITRRELAEQVWGSETFVDFEQGLNFAIRQIRTALEDDSDHPSFVETLPRRGYRFIAEVKPVDGQTRPDPVPVNETTEQVGGRKPASLFRKSVVVVGICALPISIFLGYRLINPHLQSTALSPIQSIAVLPLVNLSPDANQQYFSEGLTDELITELAKAGDLRVISRTSVVAFQGSRKSAPEVGRELGVDAIVEGAVERVGSHVRIRAQLIRAASDQHLWAESYDRDLSDVLTLERDVARDVALQIGHRISGRTQAATTAISAQAHEDYLKGRYYWNKRTEADLRRSIEYFKKVIDQEPKYALAYAGLADSQIMLANWGFAPPAGAYLEAKAAALKALELDDQLAEAETSLAYATLLYDWDWQGAESRFRRAIALNPNYASAHHFYSILLMASGRQAEAAAEIERARQLDPLSLIVNDVVGWIAFEGRQYEAAIQQFTRTLEIDPNYVPVLLDLGTVYLRRGEYPKAIALFERARLLSGENGVVLSGLAQAYALSGKRAQALQILHRTQSASKPIFVSSWDMAFIYAALSEKQKAIASLAKAADDHVGWVVRLRIEPAFDNLRSEPQFEELVRRVGIPGTNSVHAD